METPPILLLTFNRPNETKRVFQAIRNAKPKRLFVATDAPRPGNEKDVILCKETLDAVSNVDWDCELKILKREKNIGSYNGIISAITWFFEHVDQGIILEDDCLPGESFFTFSGEMLEKYKNNENVGIISGNNFVQKNILEKINPKSDEYYFTHTIYTWGYATWKRVWNKYDKSLKSWLQIKKDRLMYKIYSNKNVAGLFSDYFEMVYDGRYRLYDITLLFTCISNNMLCIIPPRNLVSNIGYFGIRGRGETPVSNIPAEYIDISKLKHPKNMETNDQIENLIFDVWGYSKFSSRRFFIQILDIFGLHGIVRKIYRIFYKKHE